MNEKTNFIMEKIMFEHNVRFKIKTGSTLVIYLLLTLIVNSASVGLSSTSKISTSI